MATKMTIKEKIATFIGIAILAGAMLMAGGIDNERIEQKSAIGTTCANARIEGAEICR